MCKILFLCNCPVLVTGLASMAKSALQVKVKEQTVASLNEMEKALALGETQLLVLDLSLIDHHEINLLRYYLKQYPLLKIIVLHQTITTLHLKKLYAIGVLGILDKKSDLNEVASCFQRVYKKELYIGHSVLLELLSTQPPFLTVEEQERWEQEQLDIKLSSREKAVAKLLLQGKSNSDICKMLVLRPSTVSTFKKKIFVKLHITNLIELDRFSQIAV